MRYAVIENGIVTNVVLADDDAYAAEQGWVPCEDAGPGWRYEEGAFSTPLPSPGPVPSVVSRFQGRAALLLAGHLEAAENIIASADAMTRLAWSEAIEWRRESPTISALGAALGMTSEQVDDLFRQAAGIEA